MIWNANPELISAGPLHVRWYGAFFAFGFVVSYRILKKMLFTDGLDLPKLDSLLWYMMASTVIGARLGHCLFYQPEIYLPDPLRILKVWEGGLASHGAALGIITGCALYARKWKDYTTLQVLDRVGIGVAVAGAFIRLGNFFNSEIIGKPSDLPWAVTFARVDQIPRHPAQLYESLTYFIIFGIVYRVYWHTKLRERTGFIFGLTFLLLSSARLLLEFFKENQEPFEGSLPLNMGQLLSIPLILACAYLMWSSANRKVIIPLRAAVSKKAKR